MAHLREIPEPTCSCGRVPCPYAYKAARNPTAGWRGPDGVVHRIARAEGRSLATPSAPQGATQEGEG